MWLVLKALLKEEVCRLWRRVLRRPEPPSPYAEFQAHRQRVDPTPRSDSK